LVAIEVGLTHPHIERYFVCFATQVLIGVADDLDSIIIKDHIVELIATAVSGRTARVFMP
jgi:hypothetical protein